MNPTSLTTSQPHRLACFPYGVGHGSEGVCLLVEMGPHRILLDCGLKNLKPLQKTAHPPVEMVFCTHAHADHARGLLALHQTFPQLPIFASEVTAKLLPLNWLKYSGQPIDSFCQILPWRSQVELSDDLSVMIYPAGHLPGAAAILLTYTTPKRTYRLLYTGDFFLSNSRLVEGLSIEELRGLAPDVLIIEGSYGTARYSRRRQQENQLMERINQAIANYWSVLLPVPTLGLGQEILMLLRSHHQFTGRDLEIWVGGTVAYGCDTYLDLLTYFPASVQNFAKHQPLFWDERVRPRMHRLLPGKQPITSSAPCVILTDYQADLQQYCSPESGSWLILLPEQPRTEPDTELERLISAATAQGLQIETYFLAQHSDGLGTTQLIHNLRPQHVIFVHGSPAYLADLTSLEELQNRYQLHLPASGKLVELPIGDTFIQPETPPETNYQGELNEQENGVNITIPKIVNTDPRWQSFADTGLIEARWQGEELVLRGVSQKELLTQTSKYRLIIDVDCCGVCRHQRGQRCWNQASPLYGFKVTPEGYCPVFEPLETEIK